MLFRSVTAPLIVTFFADAHGFSAAVRPTAIFPLIALALILLLLPETANKELEETARV